MPAAKKIIDSSVPCQSALTYQPTYRATVGKMETSTVLKQAERSLERSLTEVHQGFQVLNDRKHLSTINITLVF